MPGSRPSVSVPTLLCQSRCARGAPALGQWRCARELSHCGCASVAPSSTPCQGSPHGRCASALPQRRRASALARLALRRRPCPAALGQCFRAPALGHLSAPESSASALRRLERASVLLQLCCARLPPRGAVVPVLLQQRRRASGPALAPSFSAVLCEAAGPALLCQRCCISGAPPVFFCGGSAPRRALKLLRQLAALLPQGRCVGGAFPLPPRQRCSAVLGCCVNGAKGRRAWGSWLRRRLPADATGQRKRNLGHAASQRVGPLLRVAASLS